MRIPNFINPLPTTLWLRFQQRYDGLNGAKRKGYNPNYEGPGDWLGHKGGDFEAEDYGERLVASASGYCFDSDYLNTGAGHGEVLWIGDDDGPAYEGASGWLVRCIHMRKGSPQHEKGDRVEQGDLIGLVGDTGQTGYPHVHAEWRRVEHLHMLEPAVSQGVPYDPILLGIQTNTPDNAPAVPEEAVNTIIITRRTLTMVPEGEAYPPGGDQEVREMQAQLAQRDCLDPQPGLNYNTATLLYDGDFGPSTKAGLKQYQATHDLAPDGVCGPATLTSLYSRGY